MIEDMIETAVEERSMEAIEDKREVLLNGGVPVRSYHERTLAALQRIHFIGDESAADLAVKIAQEHGWEIIQVSRVWEFRDNKRTVNPYWEIELYP